MSSRRSLYRTNRSHTSLYGPRTDTSVTHWHLDFVSINTTRDEEAAADAPQKTNSFRVKTWVQVPGDAFKPLNDGVEGDTLPFIKHAHADGALGLIDGHESSEPPADSGGKPSTNGLTSVLTDSSQPPTGATTPGPELGADVTPAVTPAMETPAEGTSAEGTDSERASREISSTEAAAAVDKIGPTEGTSGEGASRQLVEGVPIDKSQATSAQPDATSVTPSDVAGTDVQSEADVSMPDAQ